MAELEISFETAKLAKLCGSEKKLRGKYGPRQAGLIQQRLLDLAAAETLAVMRLLPGRCHELKGDFAGQLAMDLVHPDRLVFRPDHDPVPKKDGALIWEAITKIEVVGIGDYHN